MSNIKTKSFILGAGVSLAVLTAAVAWGEAKPGEPVNRAPTDAAPMGAPYSFAPIVQKVSPAVVSIDIVGHASPSEAAEMQQEQDQDQGQGFFGFPGMGQQAPQSGEAKPLPKIRASGSGFFISPSGYIVTNNHVVQDAQEITVHTAADRSFKAHVVGRDPATDIAVVKVDGGPFPYVSFEDSAKPHVGDWVVAVGNPFGLGGTATAGIVSALGRENVADSPLVNYMQIDAPINRGNSGGPTFDVRGRVVGVNTAIYTPSGGSVGIGFDIPAATVSTIANQLIEYGHVSHGYLGATVQQLTPDLSNSLGIKTTDGAIVDQLSADGPAQRAGLRPGDVIVSVNGQTVKSPTELTQQVAFSSPGAALRLDVLRNGQPVQLTVHAGVRPPSRRWRGWSSRRAATRAMAATGNSSSSTPIRRRFIHPRWGGFAAAPLFAGGGRQTTVRTLIRRRDFAPGGGPRPPEGGGPWPGRRRSGCSPGRRPTRRRRPDRHRRARSSARCGPPASAARTPPIAGRRSGRRGRGRPAHAGWRPAVRPSAGSPPTSGPAA